MSWDAIWISPVTPGNPKVPTVYSDLVYQGQWCSPQKDRFAYFVAAAVIASTAPQQQCFCMAGFSAFSLLPNLQAAAILLCYTTRVFSDFLKNST